MKLKPSTSNFFKKAYWWFKATLLVVAISTIAYGVGSDNDQSVSGIIKIYNPSSTTYVKHFMARSQAHAANDNSYDNYCSGYFNTTSAITGIQFKATSGNLEAGTFKLYGVN